MPKTDILEIARKMRGPGGAGRVLVLDVDFSSRTNGIELGARANRHAYYIRPAEGMSAADLKHIFDEAGGEEALTFHYFVYPELQTDLKPILSADPYAGKHFDRNDSRRLLQIDGERTKARETIAALLEALKEPFNPADFTTIHEFVLRSFKPATPDGRAEMVLLRRDGDRNAVRRAEPGFHIAVAEHGFAKEIDLYRPIIAESEPVIILCSNEHTTTSGHAFLSDLAAYFGSETYAERSKLADQEAPQHAAPVQETHASSHPQAVWAQVVQPTKLDEHQLVAKVLAAVQELVPAMKLLKKREVSRRGPYVTIQFPGVLGFGKGPSPNEIKEIESVFRAISGDPSFGSGWRPHYQIDRKTGEVRVTTSADHASTKDWTAL